MVACRILVFALLSSAWQVTGAIFRHSTRTSGSQATVTTGAKTVTNTEDVRRLAGLMDVERDLEVDKTKDDVNLRDLESQIVTLVRKRDVAKRDEARKDREIAFLQNQIGRIKSSVSTESSAAATAQVAQESQQESQQGSQVESKAQADLNVDAAIASADQVVKQAEAADSAVRRSEEKVDTSAQVSTDAEFQKKAQAEAEAAAAAEKRRAEAEAEAAAAAEKRKAEAAAEAEAEAVAAGKKRKAEAESEQESRAAFEARIQREAEEKARMKIQAEQEAEARLRAEAEAKAKAKLAAEEAAKQKAEEAEHKKAEEEEKKKNALADSADDSFKNFMKEEDGEDQMGDADYEDSANALAGAIGWNRNDIEKKADDSVKALTEAIGGKKVVRSLQGMMAGVR